ncbi:hypothetical protein BOTBODRAFT_34880 [Botryobasidium botryosum FD-172 SS1]|uniref:Sulfhydryl oxidase n=1 Tax=Botryobasidium botryosum (strain FD-172 SS1) TaxID=930990 RepID=A0A067MKC7_BOTB1|nr:hypothetical protein BOTBODRAFT_34880 [Botryobasidium botryosum FD-172 SS1]
MLSRFTKLFLIVALILTLFASLLALHPPARVYIDPWTGRIFGEGGVDGNDINVVTGKSALSADVDVAKGKVIMPVLGNATAKALLGQSTWRLLHTMTLRYPEHPTPDERAALKSYFYLQARLYPCGECAEEFQQLLEKYPPQTSSRKTASLWLCHIHNLVNERLKKPQYDCMKLDETYDCGCGDDPVRGDAKSTPESTTAADGGPPRIREGDIGEDELTGEGMIKGGARR